MSAAPDTTPATAWDVVVVGGGPAGTAAARTLALVGRRVLVLEDSEYEEIRPGEGLPPLANVLLERLGVTARFLSSGPRAAFAIRSAWGGETLVEASFLRSPHGSGWHVDRRRFDSMLAAAAEEAGAVVRRSSCVIAVSRRGPEIEVAVAVSRRGAAEQSGRAVELLRARRVVDASGRRATVARRLGARRVLLDRMVAVIGLLRSRSPVGDEAEVLVLEAQESGYFYSVPLPPDEGAEGGSALLAAFLCDGDTLAESHTDPRAFWASALAASTHTRERAAAYPVIASVRARSAASAHLTAAGGDGWLAAGDSAAAFDPLAAQGIEKALEQGIAAGEATHAALSGDMTAIADYMNDVNRRVASYLRERGRYYSMEERWPAARFWCRRAVRGRAVLRLDPETKIAAAATPPPSALDAAEAWISPAEVRAVLSACANPCAAHEALRRAREKAPGAAADERLIFALQRLIERGAVVRV